MGTFVVTPSSSLHPLYILHKKIITHSLWIFFGVVSWRLRVFGCGLFWMAKLDQNWRLYVVLDRMKLELYCLFDANTDIFSNPGVASFHGRIEKASGGFGIASYRCSWRNYGLSIRVGMLGVSVYGRGGCLDS